MIRALLICVGFLFSICSRAGDNNTKSLLWEVTGNGMQKPSYIYGTIHVINKKDFFITPKVKKSLKKSDKLIMELALDKPDLKIQMTDMLMPQGFSLDSVVGKENYARLSKFIADSLHLSADLFRHMKPVFVYQMITGLMMGQDIASYEMVFTEAFQKASKPIEGLETLDFQLSLMNKIPYSEQTKMLMDCVDHFAKSKTEIEALVENYKKEDLEALRDSKEEDPKIEQLLLNGRNEQWVPKIKQLMGKQSNFIAVGAAHLAGPEGLLNLLRKEGYSVTAVAR